MRLCLLEVARSPRVSRCTKVDRFRHAPCAAPRPSPEPRGGSRPRRKGDLRSGEGPLVRGGPRTPEGDHRSERGGAAAEAGPAPEKRGGGQGEGVVPEAGLASMGSGKPRTKDRGDGWPDGDHLFSEEKGSRAEGHAGRFRVPRRAGFFRIGNLRLPPRTGTTIPCRPFPVRQPGGPPIDPALEDAGPCRRIDPDYPGSRGGESASNRGRGRPRGSDRDDVLRGYPQSRISSGHLCLAAGTRGPGYGNGGTGTEPDRWSMTMFRPCPVP